MVACLLHNPLTLLVFLPFHRLSFLYVLPGMGCLLPQLSRSYFLLGIAAVLGTAAVPALVAVVDPDPVVAAVAVVLRIVDPATNYPISKSNR